MTTTVLAYIPSPAQGVWHVGGIPLRAYALFIIVGIIAALVIGDRRWTARGGEPGVIYDIALWAVPFGLLGGRLYHIITDWPTYFGPTGAGFGAALSVWDGGLGIWGAVALGGVGAWIGCRRRGIPLPAFGDAIAPGIILAQAIGRLGNYFNQELYGRATTLPWGLEIYERRNAAGALDMLNGVSTGQLLEVVHPTFLYELLWNLLVFAVLIIVDRRFKIGHGRVFALYVAGYCVGRFWIELMRSDTATLLAGIRVNSFTSTFVFIGAVVYIMAAPKGREDPQTLRGKQDSDEDEDVPVDELLVAATAPTGVLAGVKAAGGSGPDVDPEDLTADVDEDEVTDIAAADADGSDAEAEADADDFGDESEVAEEPAPEAEADDDDLGDEIEAAAENVDADDADDAEADELDGTGADEAELDETEAAADEAVEDVEVAEEPAPEAEADDDDLGDEIEAAAENVDADDADDAEVDELDGTGADEAELDETEAAADEAVEDVEVAEEPAPEAEADDDDLGDEIEAAAENADADDADDADENGVAVEGDAVAEALAADTEDAGETAKPAPATPAENAEDSGEHDAPVEFTPEDDGIAVEGDAVAEALSADIDIDTDTDTATGTAADRAPANDAAPGGLVRRLLRRRRNRR
ncbi:prolipoprotein diacylglyceryl transferase [Mycolicibacterium sp.]|uniref:prolipoprotein diacylglyceryl transferase n=1 Tax=Mycolicibacterium sp. TaxID=2320850 RepID=UPI003D0F6988